jgi:hypothetical protein
VEQQAWGEVSAGVDSAQYDVDVAGGGDVWKAVVGDGRDSYMPRRGEL